MSLTEAEILWRSIVVALFTLLLVYFIFNQFNKMGKP